MSGGISNLGMGLNPGLYGQLTQQGQAVYDANPLANQGPQTAAQLQSAWNAWVPQWNESVNEVQRAQSASASNLLANLAQQGVSVSDDFASQIGQINPSYRGYFDAQQAGLQNAVAQKQQAEALQQQAYAQQTGGGFTGGLLNSTYSQPFSNVLGANTTGSQGFTGGMMGAGQAPAASTGLNQWMPQGMGSSPSAGNSGGWGGPFGVKNPWSMS